MNKSAVYTLILIQSGYVTNRIACKTLAEAKQKGNAFVKQQVDSYYEIEKNNTLVFSTVRTEQEIKARNEIDLLYNLFDAKKVSANVSYNAHEPDVVYVSAEWGDWKHTHGYIKELMAERGYKLLGSDITGQDGSDCYSAVHKFRKVHDVEQKTCIHVYREKGIIKGYQLADKTKKSKFYTAQEVKELLKCGSVSITNLTLTKDNRIVTKGTCTFIADFKSEEDIKKFMGKHNLMNRVEKINTAFSHCCYLLSIDEHNHLLYIPENVELLTNNPNFDLLLKLQRLSGNLKVYGGKNLKTTRQMFEGCTFDFIDFTQFDTSNVEDMTGMFSTCTINGMDLSNFDTRNVVMMQDMFANSAINYMSLASFDTNKTEITARMFYYSKINTIDVSSFNFEKIEVITRMFANCEANVIKVGNFNPKKAEDLTEVFSGIRLQELDLSTFSIYKHQIIKGLFARSAINKLDLRNINKNEKNIISVFQDYGNTVFNKSVIKLLIINKKSKVFKTFIQQYAKLTNTQIVEV